jgi:hypothetical protein
MKRGISSDDWQDLIPARLDLVKTMSSSEAALVRNFTLLQNFRMRILWMTTTSATSQN